MRSAYLPNAASELRWGRQPFISTAQFHFNHILCSSQTTQYDTFDCRDRTGLVSNALDTGESRTAAKQIASVKSSSSTGRQLDNTSGRWPPRDTLVPRISQPLDELPWVSGPQDERHEVFNKQVYIVWVQNLQPCSPAITNGILTCSGPCHPGQQPLTGSMILVFPTPLLYEPNFSQGPFSRLMCLL